jgi:hypothetical protein
VVVAVVVVSRGRQKVETTRVERSAEATGVPEDVATVVVKVVVRAKKLAVKVIRIYERNRAHKNIRGPRVSCEYSRNQVSDCVRSGVTAMVSGEGVGE